MSTTRAAADDSPPPSYDSPLPSAMKSQSEDVIESICFCVRWAREDTLYFKVHPDTPMAKVLECLRERWNNNDERQMLFYFKGQQVQPADTPTTIGLTNRACIVGGVDHIVPGKETAYVQAVTAFWQNLEAEAETKRASQKRKREALDIINLETAPPLIKVTSPSDTDQQQPQQETKIITQLPEGQKVYVFTFKDRMRQLAEFKKQFGHTNVPTAGNNPYCKFGIWLAMQRSLYQKNSLNSGRVMQFRQLGCSGFGLDFGLDFHPEEDKTTTTIELPAEEQLPEGQKLKSFTYADRIQQLVDYKKKFGHANVPTSRNDPYCKLGFWLAAQRSLYRKNNVHKERVADFRKLGCSGFGGDFHSKESKSTTLAVSSDDLPAEVQVRGSKRFTYEERMQQVVEYKKLFGHCNVPTSLHDPYCKLGGWLAAQRCLYRKQNLQKERLAEIRKLGCPGFGGDFHLEGATTITTVSSNDRPTEAQKVSEDESS